MHESCAVSMHYRGVVPLCIIVAITFILPARFHAPFMHALRTFHALVKYTRLPCTQVPFCVHHRFKYDISPAQFPRSHAMIRACIVCTCHVLCVQVSFHPLTQTRAGNSVWFTRLSNRLASYFMAIMNHDSGS